VTVDDLSGTDVIDNTARLYEQAARILGVPRWRTTLRITLPLVLMAGQS